MEPPLALGQAVHEVIESLSVLPSEERLKISLLKRFAVEWEKVSGRRGGFKSHKEEEEYKKKGEIMLKRVMDNPGPILNKAIKIKQELPHYYLSEVENIILCGKIDWLEYLEESDSVHIIDFKTGKHEEKGDSLQLPIYHLLVKNTQSREVSKTSYWYLLTSDSAKEAKLPNLNESSERILATAKRIKLTRQLEHYMCPSGGCRYCLPLEEISKGKGELVGVSSYGQDIYII